MQIDGNGLSQMLSKIMELDPHLASDFERELLSIRWHGSLDEFCHIFAVSKLNSDIAIEMGLISDPNKYTAADITGKTQTNMRCVNFVNAVNNAKDEIRELVARIAIQRYQHE